MSKIKKKIAFLATDGYEDLELHYPRIRLIEAGFDTELISLHRREIIGKHGYPIKPDKLIREANPDDYDGVIIPGGTKNPDYLRRDKDILDFVKKVDEKGKLVGAICHAGWVLISAKVIKNRKATSYFAIRDDMINAGAKFEDSSVVIDENLITSRMPDDLPDFMKAVLGFLKDNP
ncbi:MAG: type 1 glutamine amidotransferase domain-containing protein [Promethearchaeota archaeon]